MVYLSERLTNQYKTWGKGTCEFVDAQTGCGKTTFVLDCLLPYMAQQGKKILYLVNRKILKKQIEEEMTNKKANLLSNIDVMTYQALETEILINQYERMNITVMKKYMSYDCVVCDECHYFLADAMYNTRTFLSFIWIIENFHNRIRVYMSATIADVRVLVEAYDKNYALQRTNQYRLNKKSYEETCDYQTLDFMRKESRKERDYSYFTVKVYRSREEILERIKENQQEKWLIFINNIAEATSLRNKIAKMLTGKDVDSIDASYDSLDEAVQIVDNIVKNKTFAGKVLIATSVLDNGVSLVDSSIRNVVISIDNEIEFIQMIGRVRRESDEDNKILYINAQRLEIFSNRLLRLKQKKKYADGIYKQYIAKGIEGYDSSLTVSIDDWVRLPDTNILGFSNTGYGIGSAMRSVRSTQGSMGHIRSDVNEQQMIWSMHSQIMRDLRDCRVDYDIIQSICFIANGQFYFSRLAYEKMQLQITYYDYMCKAMKEDANAFVKEQLSWLNKSEEAQVILMNEFDRAKEQLEHSIAEVLSSKEGDASFDMREFEKNNREAYNILIRNIDVDENIKKTMQDSVYKTDRSLSVDNFNLLSKKCNLKYSMERKDKKQVFTKKVNN